MTSIDEGSSSSIASLILSGTFFGIWNQQKVGESHPEERGSSQTFDFSSLNRAGKTAQKQFMRQNFVTDFV